MKENKILKSEVYFSFIGWPQ